MASLFTDATINVVYSIVATGVVGVCISLYKTISSKKTFGYPFVAGMYKTSYPNNKYSTETVEISQFGPWIRGRIHHHESGLVLKFYGKVLHCRMFFYNFEAGNYSDNCRGTAMLKLARSSDEACGYIIFLSKDNETLSTTGVVFKKNK